MLVHINPTSHPKYFDKENIPNTFVGHPLLEEVSKDKIAVDRIQVPTFKTQQLKQEEQFQCEGKIWCSDMRSYEEAVFYLRNCPGTKMDGDGDGIPCERQF